jgi:hypothetical protein
MLTLCSGRKLRLRDQPLPLVLHAKMHRLHRRLFAVFPSFQLNGSGAA